MYHLKKEGVISLFTIQTWVTDTWYGAEPPVPSMSEVKKHFYLFEDPKNHLAIDQIINDSNGEPSGLLFGFVHITYNGQEILGKRMFSQIFITWHSYEMLLKQMQTQNFANVEHPETGYTAVTVRPDDTAPNQIILETFFKEGAYYETILDQETNQETKIFHDIKTIHETFILPRKEFLKALYDALINYRCINLKFFKVEDHKQRAQEYLDKLLATPLY